MSAGERAQARLDRIAKPLRSLGRLEELIVQLADIQGTEDVCIAPRCALVCAGHLYGNGGGHCVFVPAHFGRASGQRDF